MKPMAAVALLVLIRFYQIGSAPEMPPVASQDGSGGTIASAMVVWGHKPIVTPSMEVSAGFYATGSPYWDGGIHGGVDYVGAEGTPVYLPFDGTFLASGYYSDEGRRGFYQMFTLSDGAEYYSGHLENIVAFLPGQSVGAGTLIGYTNDLNHTHVQLRINGQLADFGAYYAAH